MLKKFFFIALILTLFAACKQTDKIEKEIAQIPIEFKTARFDKAFAQAIPADLPKLKAEFPMFFPVHEPDSVWVALITDSLQIELRQEVMKAYPDLSELKKDLTGLFQHLKYYYPKFKAPGLITLTSEIDYLNRVIVTDSLLLISLDNYLGAEHEFYGGIQKYFSKNFTRNRIVPDVAGEYAEKLVPRPQGRTFLDFMVYYGKLHYFQERMLPDFALEQIMGYTKDELDWAEANERQIWGYFIENELLYQTDSDLHRKFLDPGPFSRFGLELDSESPAQLGKYIGWQMVRQFAAKNKDMSLTDLLKMNNETLFKESKYKPKQR